MIINQRAKGIQVQVKDTISKKSKSFTVHGMSFDKLFCKLLFYASQLAKFTSIKLVCYKKKEKEKESETDETNEKTE